LTVPNSSCVNLPALEILTVSPRRSTADEVFILRFWREQDGLAQEFRWRGQIRSVSTRERHTADGADAAFALIKARLQVASGLEDRQAEESDGFSV
jgi:hypothetical protein